MTKIERHYELIGRLLAFLVGQGLSRVTLQPSTAREIIGPDSQNEQTARDFVDVVLWMVAEGLIRIGSYTGGLLFTINEVQLTSKGIALIREEPDGNLLDASIEDTLADSSANGLDAPTYTKIGALVGSLLGGFTKSIG